jgi:hypothetical protein
VSTHLSVTGLLVVVLAVWRITHLLWGEDGPFDALFRLRRSAGQTFLGQLLDCFYCLSLWTSLPFAYFIGANWPERIAFWFGFSGGAILLERATVSRTPPALWSETPSDPQSVPPSVIPAVSANPHQEEHPDVMLR